jgi:hypothetical protein
MLRQRIRLHSSLGVFVGQLVASLFALALLWYGLMVLLLAVKVSPHTVNSLSGYRTIFNWLAHLKPHDVAGEPTRVIIAGGGVVGFLVFGYLAYRMVPRGHLTRRDLTLDVGSSGSTVIGPRALERLVEVAVARDPAVTEVSGRYGDDELNLNITTKQARDVDGTLRRARQHAVDAVAQHELPAIAVNVTLTGYDRRQRRELQ